MGGGDMLSSLEGGVAGSPGCPVWRVGAGCRPRAKNCWCSWLIKKGEPGITCILPSSGLSETEEKAISRSR